MVLISVKTGIKAEAKRKMKNFPQFFLSLKTFFGQIEGKNKQFKIFFLNSFLFLFIGLFIGSLFGTFLDVPRSSGFWDGLIILSLVFSCEFLNLLIYTYKFGKLKVLNYLKLGLLLALFIDAFKVGS